ncbi:hypothetical protein CANINC_001561 [Pichia inconspicua]|uniref:UBC core domain-containing protein n=1 Tax=Pichia inconspicua TaxID=52247 RepID=A0A4T0X3F8_9ASCO|nr:hypothetical protein CANINC_001561 [[Candida] inconspicua]
MATQKRLLKELKTVGDVGSLPASIVELQPVDMDDLYRWQCVIHISEESSYYNGAYFQLDISIPFNYPLEPPTMKFVTTKDNIANNRYPISTKIAHCNVDFKSGDICLDILKKETWSPAWTIQSAVLAVVVLLDNQEPDSPLNIDMANLVRSNDKTAIASLIQYYIKSSDCNYLQSKVT